MKENKKELLKEVNFLLQIIYLVIGYLGISLVAILFSVILIIFIDLLPVANLDAIHLSITYGSTVVLLIFIGTLFKPFIQYLLLCLKDKKGIVEGIIIAVCAFTASYLYSLCSQWIFGNIGSNDNQSSLQVTFEAMPILSFFPIVIFAPICEEFTYRYGLFGLVSRKSKQLAWIITILFFALIHFNFDQLFTFIQTGNFAGLKVELINLPAYLIGAAFLTYAYSREENIVCSITAHSVYNLSQYILMVITTFIIK